MSKQSIAIALCRVSSLEQLENNSLSDQKDNVLKAAEMLNVTIPPDGIWSGHVSSKKGVNYNRKDLKEMLDYCRKHPAVKYLIVQEVDRFMRSPDEQVYFQVKFQQEVGVKIWYADKPELNKDDIYAGLMRYMEGFRAAGSNDERQRKSINGQIHALEKGRYPFSPKPGYTRGSKTGIQEIHPIKGPILKDALLNIVSYKSTPTQALIDLNNSDFVTNHSQYKMDKFRRIVTDCFYAGIVEIDKQVKVRNENGLHEPLITREQHLKLVEIMDNKKKTQAGPRKNGNPKYPLSNLVNCDPCAKKKNGRVVGFDHGNGKNRKLVYEKYRCRECRRYLTRDTLHSEVELLIKRYSVSEEKKNGLTDALAVVWKQQEGQADQQINRVQYKIESTNEAIRVQVEAATDPSNATIKDEILSSIARKKQEVVDLSNQLYDLNNTKDSDHDHFLAFAFDFIDNVDKHFFEISKENRIRCKQLIFPGGFYLTEDNKVYTPEISPLYSLAMNKKDLPGIEKSLLVRVQGL